MYIGSYGYPNGKIAVLPRRRFALRRCAVGHFLIALIAAMLLLSAGGLAHAQSLRDGVAAYNRQDFVRASNIFIPLAERGVAPAQTWLGFMFQTGRGVPQNYTEAAMWYRRAAEQGDSLAQYSLGLLYDKGQGGPTRMEGRASQSVELRE